ncbi:MAG TPA: hypothetical protein VD735_07040, partial [Candidatus Saccharimonadales bacterium]|nr:hypothetical protein [Candidatus Saccharimonadales bacterium]
HLGKAVVISDRPVAILGPARKQWLKLARVIQKQRSATLNADKILKYTHTITRMQHMRFTHKEALQDTEAAVYFLTPAMCSLLPAHCYTIYITATLSHTVAANIIEQLPTEALIVDYDQQMTWDSLQLQPKSALERQVTDEWDRVSNFLAANDITIRSLRYADRTHNIDAMDDALDTLLSMSHRFMHIANDFQRALELARPLRIPRDLREEYDLLIILAHRVQALSPGAYSQRFLESYNEDDTFFLYDHTKRRFVVSGESLAEAVQRHLHAGRRTLARRLHAALS